MKILLIILTCVISNSIMLGQSLAEINESCGLSDSLTNTEEIRVYKKMSFRGTDVFRMYLNDSGIWMTDFFEVRKKRPKSKKYRNKKRELNAKIKLKTIWWEILKTNIEGLPDMSKIRWKLKKRTEVVVNKKGDKILTWGGFIGVNDGESYVVQLNFENTSKKIKYYNPYVYLRHHSDIDELIYFTKMIDIIKNEFNIWKSD
ncbi:hypothetical protein [Flavivirga algicola]|uniref:Uncharacterized protein n=1 Tax=Flavivirga algicola TaxID=2729136 RepID=A0ABX1RYI7_9FLAO|nr:hypothetical protein [Flavivirga algicola]NMH88103.1 hypothetical protein [Flavivirga algicola]